MRFSLTAMAKRYAGQRNEEYHLSEDSGVVDKFADSASIKRFINDLNTKR